MIGVQTNLVSTAFLVIKYHPQIHPVLIKPLYELLEKNKNNWMAIKLIKIVPLASCSFIQIILFSLISSFTWNLD